MKNQFFTLFSVLFLLCVMANEGFSQEIWTLEKCITYAQKNNIQIKQQELSVRTSKNQMHQSYAEVLPSVNASASDNYNMGRSVDKYTNQFFNQTVHNQNFSINSSMELFNGLQTFNTIRQNRFNMLASLQDLQKMRNDITLNIASAYLQILYSEELLEISKKQLEISKDQVKKTQIMVDAGKLAKGSLFDIQAQFASDELTLINSENQLKNDYLNLIQMLDLDTIANFKILRPELPDPTNVDSIPSENEILADALKLPQIKSAEFRNQSSHSSLLVAYGRMSPKLTLNGSISSGYSDARKNTQSSIGPLKEIGYVTGTNQKVVAPSFITEELDYPFSDQIRDNQSKSLSFSLSVPLFSNLQILTGIGNARLNFQNTGYQVQLAHNQLYKDIQQARNDVVSSRLKSIYARRTYDAMLESFSYTQEKYNVGMVTTLDFNISKNKLAKSQSDMLQAKFEYIFKKNVLNFYRGKPISLN